MSVGLLALLDDVAAIAKVAAASVDDVLGHAAKAGAKSAGVVIDDAAVTPRYVTGFAAERELPIILRITYGSLRNKLLFLLPTALALGFFAPWAITPLLMLGGAYLAYEGAEKVFEVVFPHGAHEHEAKLTPTADPKALENQKVASAIKTDFILSAEIMAITLAAIPVDDMLTRAAVLAVVAVVITLGVYGTVALIVKADDVGLALAQRGPGPISRAIGRGLVRGMPGFLRVLTVVGTAAMIWVGGGILVHGLATFGFVWPEHVIRVASEAAAQAVPVATGFVGWVVSAAGAGVAGLAVGFMLIPLVGSILAPLVRWVVGLVMRDRPAGHNGG
jgi:predicted DNA repair protein MutK